MALCVASLSSDVDMRAIVPCDDGSFAEAKPPAELPSRAVTAIAVYGSLFFAGARTLERALPRPAGATWPVVVFRLRGYTRAGATLVEVLDRYADDLADVGGRLYLSGVDEELASRLPRAGKLDLDEAVRLIPADAVIGASTREALARVARRHSRRVAAPGEGVKDAFAQHVVRRAGSG